MDEVDDAIREAVHALGAHDRLTIPAGHTAHDSGESARGVDRQPSTATSKRSPSADLAIVVPVDVGDELGLALPDGSRSRSVMRCARPDAQRDARPARAKTCFIREWSRPCR